MRTCVTLLLSVATAMAAISGRHLEQHDALVAARCIAMCWTPQKPQNESCANKCVGDAWAKPGSCPKVLSDYEAACVDVCVSDSECPGTTKCCHNNCGVTCQRPMGLHDVTGLPLVPVNLTVTERRRGRAVLVEWSAAEGDSLPVVYVLQERHHLGHHFTASRLTPWAHKHRSLRPKATLKNNALRPGRWYQFRVAAVNEHGTRGFSEASTPFTLTAAPKAPRAPQKLKVGSLRRVNGTLWGEMTWEPPASDIPIQRYKVFWSRQLLGVSSPLVSVLVNQQTVTKDTTRFMLKHLEPESMYFLQVQALSQYGRDRLKGEKAAILLNTKDYKNVTEEPPTSMDGGAKRSADRVANLRVQRVFWSGGQLIGRISWVPLQSHKTHYTVTWWSGPCQGAPSGKRVQLAATTETNTFDLYDLSFHCKYRVTVRPHGAGGGRQHEAMLVFATPSCEQLAAAIGRHEKPTCQHPARDKRTQQT